MKKLLLSLFISFIFSGSGSDYAFAQTEKGLLDLLKPEKVLFVEMFLPENEISKSPTRLKVPNNFDFDIEKGVLAVVVERFHCTDCGLAPHFFWIKKAEKIEGGQTKIDFEISFPAKSDCDIDGELTINQNKKETTELKCGVKLVTYYAPDVDDNNLPSR